jgi:hypothetical protein
VSARQIVSSGMIWQVNRVECSGDAVSFVYAMGVGA